MTIIGAGPGGYTAAFAAARAGARVTLVERDRLGGTCLNNGCIPTKTIKASAEALESAGRLAEFGVQALEGALPGFRADMPAIVARKERVCGILRGGLEKTCAALKIRLLRGRAELSGGLGVLVHNQDGTTNADAEAILLAPGSRPLELPALPVDHTRIISSDDALRLDRVPSRLLVVGGGVIGCELAFLFRAFGSEVTIVEGLSRLLPLPSVDEDISSLLRREAKKRGIRVEASRVVQRAERKGDSVLCTLAPSPFVEGSAGPETQREADVVLVAVGRSPATSGLGLDKAGVETDARGWIRADPGMRTTAPGIYAVGDILGPSRVMLAHAASAEALCAVANCLGEKRTLEYRSIPSAIFTSPEIGVVGLSEAQAREQGLSARSGVFPFRELGKAQAMGELPGLFKLVCEEPGGKVLGAAIAGAHATDLIAEAALAVARGLSVMDIARTVHAHPTLAEGLYEAAAIWMRG
jgi:dihydrolipoamide dehydrogenase